MTRIHFLSLPTWVLLASLSACGGNDQENNTSDNTIQPQSRTASMRLGSAQAPGDSSTDALTAGSVAVDGTKLTTVTATQFLNQATFGPTAASVSALMSSSKAEWISAQFQKPRTAHLPYVQKILATGAFPHQNLVFETFWKQAVTGEDQLRQRVTFALSEIFVISMVDGGLFNRPAGVASYYDALAQHAFGNFRDLLQAVALHPMMGIYLSHLHNQKESEDRTPDENFAREIMQLMTIGLYQMNPDGSAKTSGGKLIDTYTHDDVMGLAKVFTGWSWAGPDKSSARFFGTDAAATRDWTPMQQYPEFHSTTQKSFLGVSTNGSGEADLKVALDTLFNHPNVGPFIGRQLIQRLVTSNPSRAYIGRVAAAFANNGAGVRGDMRAVIRAVLLDPEAGSAGAPAKLREPVLRLANWMRAFGARSASGRYLMQATDDPLGSLGQAPLRAPSVFNFFRPGYIPPNTALSSAGKVAPEMQITGEPAVIGYLNYMQIVIPYGVGASRDIQADYSAEIALASKPPELVDRINLLLFGGQMSSELRNQIISAVQAVWQPALTAANAAVVDSTSRNRVYLAIYLAMASPEYLVQH